MDRSLISSLTGWIELTRSLSRTHVFAAATLLLVVAGLLFLLLRRIYHPSRPRHLTNFPSLGPVTPLPSFSPADSPPRKWRPFKKVYNLTMGLTKTSLDEIITIDSHHLSRLEERRRIASMLPREKVCGVLPAEHVRAREAEAGVWELYRLLGEYLPARYPTLFKTRRSRGLFGSSALHPLLMPSSTISGKENDKDTWHPNPANIHTALLSILHTLDEDFLVLVPAPDGDGYIVGSFIACFPQGFDPSLLVGQRVRDIHKPVPGYKEKLQGSMERYFARLPVGQFVRRVNWSVVNTSALYTGDQQTHFHDGKEKKEEFDLENTFQRSEAQILFRLPKTKALVFVIKTYNYALEEVREEGLGEDMATAIEGLERGNVPGMFVYKRGPVWAERVKEYLRS